MIGSFKSIGAIPISSRTLAPRSAPFASGSGSDATASGLDRDTSSVGADEQAAWDAALDFDWTASALPNPADSTMAVAPSCEPTLDAIVLPSPAVLGSAASEFSHAGNSSDGQDPRHSPSTRFELLLGEASALQVDWSRQSSHWSLCLRTADSQTFALLSGSALDMSTALQAGFGCDVTVQVDRE